MASVYLKQEKYWLRYFDHQVNKWRDRPTGYRHPEDERKARALKIRLTGAEAVLRQQRGRGQARSNERWEAWVPSYLRSRYGESKTHLRYVTAWTHLEGFLKHRGITGPSGWQQAHNADYVEWKVAAGYDREPARWDLGVLAMLMNEAVRRDFITGHKVSKARIRRGVIKEKPALTDDQIALIRQGLLKCGEDLRIAFEIALHTGCRLAETSLPLDRINLERGTITFLPKGGRERMFTVPILFPEFKEWLTALVARRHSEKLTMTCQLGTHHSWLFGKLCRRLGLKGPEGERVTFHCLRVTFVTRAYEAGISSEVVRRLVNHADILVNRLYQRLSIEGLQGLGSRVRLPTVQVPASPKKRGAKKAPLGR